MTERGRQYLHGGFVGNTERRPVEVEKAALQAVGQGAGVLAARPWKQGQPEDSQRQEWKRIVKIFPTRRVSHEQKNHARHAKGDGVQRLKTVPWRVAATPGR